MKKPIRYQRIEGLYLQEWYWSRDHDSNPILKSSFENLCNEKAQYAISVLRACICKSGIGVGTTPVIQLRIV